MSSKLDSKKIHSELLKKGVHGGLVLDELFPELGHASLLATTEMHTIADHDKLVKNLEAIR
jgi:glycine cleavage system pyridoxal-binding protein P